MTNALRRKYQQLAGDPVLRRWLWRRALGRETGSTSIARTPVPYLRDQAFPACRATKRFPDLVSQPPTQAIQLPFPGGDLTLEPGDAAMLFTRDFPDIEQTYAAHRFAWLPLLGRAAEPGWIQAIWSVWAEKFSVPDDGPAWHPYTAAERVINILDYAAREGLPAPVDQTLDILAGHGKAIFDRLEYFGETYTGNHLSNNGRGLYLLGLALGDDKCAEIGCRILLEEARRIFAPSGVLREGSAHYHLLLTRNYASAYLAAKAHDRAEAGELEAVVLRAFGVLPHFDLPGGLPLVGDISPDSPPPFLSCLLPSGDLTEGWAGLADDESRQELDRLRNQAPKADTAMLVADGWLRFESGPWTGLWHSAPGGWPPMPGHGHQDAGSFELRYGGQALVVDPGRGHYGHEGDAAEYAGGSVHSGLMIDNADPAPPNRPYYSDRFRREIGGPLPELNAEADGVRMSHHGYGRLGGIGMVERRWAFSGNRMTLTDRVEGRGRKSITRRLHVAGDITQQDDALVIDTPAGRFRVRADGRAEVRPATRWRAYGDGAPSQIIEISNLADLPFTGELSIETA